MNRREEVYRKRISEGWFLYAFLELTQRQGHSITISGSLEDTILLNMPLIRQEYCLAWGLHGCDVNGCDTTIVLDGGMKPHRSVCADTLSGVTEYKITGAKVVTGEIILL